MRPMLTRTYAFLEPFIAATRPGRLVLVRRFLLALERSLRSPQECEGACVVAGHVFGLPPGVLVAAATRGTELLDAFLALALTERLDAAPEGLDARADWLVRWGPLVEALVPDGPHGASPVPDMVTLAPDLAALFARIHELARSSLALLLEGRPGTGREALARAVHAMGRGQHPFVPVDAGLLRDNYGAALFGAPMRASALDHAGDGTLFVRNLELLPAGSQHRLARMLETGARVDGDGRPQSPLRCRLIFAVTDGELGAVGTAEGKLHPDLAWRAGVLHARLPPLAERGEDLAALYRNIVRRFVLRREQPLSADEVAREPRMTLTPRALLALHAYSWPGDVAEFVSVVREARQRANQGPVELAHLPERVVAALGRGGTSPGDRLRSLLLEIAPAAVGGAEEQSSARRRVRQWRDQQLERVFGRDFEELLSRAVAAFNALSAGTMEPLTLEAVASQAKAAAAREILLPMGNSVPLFHDERQDLVAEMEAMAAASPVPGSITRRLFDLGRAAVLYPQQALAQIQPRRSPAGQEQPCALALALVATVEQQTE